MTMSTTGPAIDRRGGDGMTGAGTGLDILHLIRRRLRCLRGVAWRRWRRGWRFRSIPYFPVTFPRSVAAQQHHDSNDQDQDGPGSVPVITREVFWQRQHTNCKQHSWPHQSPRTAAFAIATITGRNQAPGAGEEPTAEGNQENGPDAAKIEIEYSHRVQQEESA